METAAKILLDGEILNFPVNFQMPSVNSKKLMIVIAAAAVFSDSEKLIKILNK